MSQQLELLDDSGYQVALPEFEGPLDLLLHLVKRHELSILEIPISFITEKYLEYLDLMRSFNIDVAGDYLLMAATLAHIKSRELLPQQPEEELDEDDEGGDPRAELIRRLLEYQRYKEAAEQLNERPKVGHQIFPRGSEIESFEPSELPLAEVGTFALLKALSEVVKRSKVPITYDVVVDRISITDKINDIVDRLVGHRALALSQIVANIKPEAIRHEIVVTFLAILEMTRLKMIRILQHETDGEIYLSRNAIVTPIVDKTDDSETKDEAHE